MGINSWCQCNQKFRTSDKIQYSFSLTETSETKSRWNTGHQKIFLHAKLSRYWWYLYYSEFFIFDMLSFIYLKLYSLRLQVLNWLSENIKIIGQYEIYWSSISRILYPRRKRAWKSDCNTYFFLNFTCFYHNSIHSSQEQ